MLLFSTMVYAAQKNEIKANKMLQSPAHQQLLTSLCSQIVMQWEEWNTTGKPSWELKKEIGDQKLVKALLELPHACGGKSDKIEKSNCIWLRSTCSMNVNDNPAIEVEDVLHVSKVADASGSLPVVGRHIWMKRPFADEKGLLGGPKYGVSADVNSKAVSWTYLNGMLMI